MTDRKTAKPKVDNLELNKETVQDLTESEAEAGGQQDRAKHAPGDERLLADEFIGDDGGAACA